MVILEIFILMIITMTIVRLHISMHLCLIIKIVCACFALLITADNINMFWTGINSVCRSAYFHLRNIRSIRNMLTDNACSQLIHALVTVRIDYCNS